MVLAVDTVSDIVHVARNLRKLNLMFAIPEFFKYQRCSFRNESAMNLWVVCVAKYAEIIISLLYVRIYFFIFLYLFVCHIILISGFNTPYILKP